MATSNALSNTYETWILNHVFRTNQTAPSGFYLALFTSAPTDSALGTEVSTSGTAYARQSIARGTGAWDAPTDSSGAQMIQNTSAITFSTATANWGTVTHYAVMDNSAGDVTNMVFYAALDTSQAVNTGGQVSFAAGAIKFSLN